MKSTIIIEYSEGWVARVWKNGRHGQPSYTCDEIFFRQTRGGALRAARRYLKKNRKRPMEEIEISL